jgi:hypothetical protein
MVSTESVLDGCNILSFKNKKSLVCNLMLSIEAGPWVYDLDMLRMHFRKVTIKMAYLIYKKKIHEILHTDGWSTNKLEYAK